MVSCRPHFLNWSLEVRSFHIKSSSNVHPSKPVKLRKCGRCGYNLTTFCVEKSIGAIIRMISLYLIIDCEVMLDSYYFYYVLFIKQLPKL